MTVITAIPDRYGQLSASRAFELASDFHRQGNLPEAAALYRRTLALAPGHFGALCGIGMIKGQQGQLDDGLSELREAARSAHGSADAHAGIGMILAAFDRREEAIERYHAALSINPYHAGAHYNLANVLLARGDAETAVAHYTKSVAIEPNNAAAHHHLGLALQKLGKWKQALQHHETATRIKPQLSEAHAGLGNSHRVLGHLAQATAHYRKALAARPDYAEVHNDLAGVLYKLGQHDTAIKHYEQSISIKPNYVEAHYNLGNVLHDLGRHNEAIQKYDEALRLRPGFAEAHNNLANALQKLGRHQEAVQRYQAAIALNPGYADAHHNFGNAVLAQGRILEAIAEFEKALAIDPANPVVYNDLAAAHLLTGNIQAAYDAYQRAVNVAPRNAAIHLNLASLKPFSTGDKRLPALLQLADDIATLGENDQIALHFALGKAYTDLTMHERALGHLLQGNRLRRGQIAYDEKPVLAAFEQLRELFTPQLMREKRGLGDPGADPIFIVGLPGSGTSLVQRILASHSRVFGIGERDAFAQAVQAALAAVPGDARKFPELVSAVSPDELRRIGRTYLERVAATAPAAARIVDATPANIGYVGLIHLAFPNARIIHARRDPIDGCLACFGRLFVDDQPYSYDLAELGRYYSSSARVMRHWRELLPDGVMLEMRYEDVINDLEAAARRLIAHCDLQWEDPCAALHGSERPVRASGDRDPVSRWLPHKAQLAPLLDALELPE